MELKQKLQDYTRAEFVALIEKIRKVDVSKQQHDVLIRHFDQVVGHPSGADLLFYPSDTEETYGYDDIGRIIHYVKGWHNDRGQLAFQDDSLPPRYVPGNQPSAAEQARNSSLQNLARVQELSRKVDEAKRNLERAFTDLEALLIDAEPGAQTTAPEGRDGLTLLEAQLDKLEAAQSAVTITMSRYDSLKSTVKFNKDDAQRSITNSFLDRGVQATILQQINHSSDQYLALLPVNVARQRDLHVRAQSLILQTEEQVIRLAAKIDAGPLKDAMAFRTSLAEIDVLPRLLTPYSDIADSFDSVLPGLKRAIHSAVGGLAWDATSGELSRVGKHASVMAFRFDKAGCGEPFAVSVPLFELAPTEARDWLYLAQMESEVDLPFRMSTDVAKFRHGTLSHGLTEITELVHVYAVATGGIVPRGVKVRAALWDADSQEYRFMRPGLPACTVSWFSHSSPHSGSSLDRKRGSGSSYKAPVRVPVVEEIPIIEDLSFDDCIVVFPYDSGIEPVYIMFKGAREYAGVASGAGQAVADSWLLGTSDGVGAPVPSQIATQLRDKVFKRFSFFRAAFWNAVANDPQLSRQFTAEDLAAMNTGRGPSTAVTPNHTQGEKLEIHHVVPPSEGGGVYDMDNMRIAARKVH